MAAQMSRPLPWETATERELGRTTITTGTPMQSRPVTSAIRVMPMLAINGRTRSTVSRGETRRCVPSR